MTKKLTTLVYIICASAFFCACANTQADTKKRTLSSFEKIERTAPAFDEVHANFTPYEDAAQPRSNSKEKFKINHAPFVQNVTENSAIITWSTNKPAVSWVEIAPDDKSDFYAVSRDKYFDAPLGRKKISKVHSIKIDGLQKATKYRYRIFSQEIKGAGYTSLDTGHIAASRVYQRAAPTFKTLDPSKKEVKFAILNDIHSDNKLLANLLNGRGKDYDFILLNGDMCSSAISSDNCFKGFLDTISENTYSSVPIVFVRGNHETRGVYAQNIQEIFKNGETTYFTFRVGPVAFIALDSGEDKPDNDIEYFDNNLFDAFRTKQALWLEGALKNELVQNAPIKIGFIHIPFGSVSKTKHGENEVRNKFAPLLNKKGVDLFFSGHFHRHEAYKPNEILDIPNIVNSNKEIVEVTADAEKIEVKIFDDKGGLVHEYSFKPKSAK